MTFDLAVISLNGKAVQVALDDGSPAFWLPRAHVEWFGLLEPGEMVRAEIPRWLAMKHSQLVASRTSTQKVLVLEKAELDPEKAKGPLPMANDTPRGALFRIPENDKKNDKWPDYRGDITIEGRKWKLAGWVKTDKNGGKYLSLVAQPFEERQPEHRQQPAGGPSFDSDIPFAPDR